MAAQNEPNFALFSLGLLIARIFPSPVGGRKNTTQLAKYPRVLHVKPSNKVYLLFEF